MIDGFRRPENNHQRGNCDGTLGCWLIVCRQEPQSNQNKRSRDQAGDLLRAELGMIRGNAVHSCGLPSNFEYLISNWFPECGFVHWSNFKNPKRLDNWTGLHPICETRQM